MPRLLNYSELSAIAGYIDIPYGSSWREIEKVCQASGFSLQERRQGSKIDSLTKALLDFQKRDNSDKVLYELIKNAFPITYVRDEENFKQAINKINEVLKNPGIDMFYDFLQGFGLIDLKNPPKGFYGLSSNAQLLAELESRGVPRELLAYCPLESFNGDGSTALFEATKGLFEELRLKVNIPAGVDGHTLINKVMLEEPRVLKFNPLYSEQDKNDQKALAALFKAAYSVIRNPLAHMPTLLWGGREDLFDYFAILSFLYKKLKKCKVESRL